MFRCHAQGNRLVGPAEGCIAMQMPAPGTFAKGLNLGLHRKNFIQADAAGLKDPLTNQDPAIVRQTGVGMAGYPHVGQSRDLRQVGTELLGAERACPRLTTSVHTTMMAMPTCEMERARSARQ